MLTIGEFSKICRVSAKTLRYYDEIGLLRPVRTDSATGYRYYDIEQLETMLFIERLKSYSFSLEEIRAVINAENCGEDKMCLAFMRKKDEIRKQLEDCSRILAQLDEDISTIKQGGSVMDYLRDIDVRLAEVPEMYILSVRKTVQEDRFPDEYAACYGKLFRRIAADRLTVSGAPMVLFHSSEFTPAGLDTEFAVPVREYATGTRDLRPGLCLKTVVHGDYSALPSVYARQAEWAENEGYQCTGALFEVYVTDPSQTADEKDLVTEVYLPVKKK